jgi:hypothetical protein
MADKAAADTLPGSLVDLSGEFGTRLERNGGEARLRVARGAPLTR